jgi:hypothetical protein
MSAFLKILAVVITIYLAFVSVACEKQGPAEKAGEKIDEAIEKTSDKIEEASEAINNKAEKVKEGVKGTLE